MITFSHLGELPL